MALTHFFTAEGEANGRLPMTASLLSRIFILDRIGFRGHGVGSDQRLTPPLPDSVFYTTTDWNATPQVMPTTGTTRDGATIKGCPPGSVTSYSAGYSHPTSDQFSTPTRNTGACPWILVLTRRANARNEGSRPK